jgi:hypothetical protein
MNNSPSESANGAGEIAHVVEIVHSLDDVFVRRCVDVIVQLCKLYGFDDNGYSRKRTYDHWIRCAAASGVHPMKFVKWKLSAFYAFHKSQLVQQTHADAIPLVLPEPLPNVQDNPSTLLTGRGYRWINYFRLKDPDMFDSFITSVLRAKTGMPRPGRELLAAEEVSTFKDLTNPETIQPRVVVPLKVSGGTRDMEITVDSFKFQLMRTVHDVFGGKTYSDDDRIRPFFPSTSANYINSRGGMGAVGVILRDGELLRGLKTASTLVDIEKEVHWSKRTGKRVVYRVNDYALRERFHRLYNRILSKAYHEKPVAVPLALPEALKVRVITKGPPYLYTALKPLQLFLWKCLQTHKTFELTGTPVTTKIVNRRMGKLRTGEFFCSADYKNATNEMMSWASETVVHAISNEIALPTEERKLFLKAMTRHVLEHPETGELKPQLHGQLMGSVVSFIVLCVVNAAICRTAIETSQGRVGQMSLDDCRMLINGDDAVFRVNDIGYRNWERIAAFVGMKPSIGKVYLSKHFLNINSTTFNYREDGFEEVAFDDSKKPETVRFQHVKSVNLGLMFGMKRSGGKTDAVDEGPTSLGARARTLISDAPPGLGEVLLKKFIHENKPALTTVNLPWFLPEYLGGVGLPNVGKYCADDLTLRLARKVHEHPDMFRLPTKPLDTPWKTWQYAVNRYDFDEKDLAIAASSVSVRHAGPAFRMASVSDIRSLFCVEALFRPHVELYVPQASPPNAARDSSRRSTEKDVRSQQLKYLRLKASVFKKALLDQSIKLPEPYRLDNLPPPDASIYDQKILHTDTHQSVGSDSWYDEMPLIGQGRKPLISDGAVTLSRTYRMMFNSTTRSSESTRTFFTESATVGNNVSS